MYALHNKLLIFLSKETIMPKKKQARFSDSIKYELVQAYVMFGENGTLACNTVGVSYRTFMLWKKTKWWNDLLDQVKSQENIQVSARLKRNINSALAIVEDRLENGDFFYNPIKGTVDRKPVSIRDAHAVFKDSHEIKNNMEKAPQEAKDKQTIQDTLLQLAKNFEDLAGKVKEKPILQVTDVIFTEEKRDAIHEERETRLQA